MKPAIDVVDPEPLPASVRHGFTPESSHADPMDMVGIPLRDNVGFGVEA